MQCQTNEVCIRSDTTLGETKFMKSPRLQVNVVKLMS